MLVAISSVSLCSCGRWGIEMRATSCLLCWLQMSWNRRYLLYRLIHETTTLSGTWNTSAPNTRGGRCMDFNLSEYQLTCWRMLPVETGWNISVDSRQKSNVKIQTMTASTVKTEGKENISVKWNTVIHLQKSSSWGYYKKLGGAGLCIEGNMEVFIGEWRKRYDVGLATSLYYLAVTWLLISRPMACYCWHGQNCFGWYALSHKTVKSADIRPHKQPLSSGVRWKTAKGFSLWKWWRIPITSA